MTYIFMREHTQLKPQGQEGASCKPHQNCKFQFVWKVASLGILAKKNQIIIRGAFNPRQQQQGKLWAHDMVYTELHKWGKRQFVFPKWDSIKVVVGNDFYQFPRDFYAAQSSALLCCVQVSCLVVLVARPERLLLPRSTGGICLNLPLLTTPFHLWVVYSEGI